MTTKKILAIILAILSVFSISVPALAVNDGTVITNGTTLDLFRKYEGYAYRQMNLKKDISCYEFSSENERIVTVDDDGTVFVKGLGTTIITAKDTETGESISVTVLGKFNLAYIVNVLTLGLFFSPVDERYREPWQILAL